jgi:hypothetical protein
MALPPGWPVQFTRKLRPLRMTESLKRARFEACWPSGAKASMPRASVTWVIGIRTFV